ncbi:sulfatase-like hydrolase/transferase [Paenilisteria rocourtiae]|uniref:Phosphoglycerol transferase MdoB-like AlkP superfamily enzyme n=1 Tax=Listeria rocourtiae TaxID=647910 RepID=A0A4V3DP50_9LIST|nr:sulfatase-like hydrolase/transferase [Listeria rocourtiae]EUJ47501.1 sulfatase family protein [Listeria rocourtiae FSL F6-920]MBC1436525.1 sulfatase-like hydrolase/transferase [Listeria rocourtiae]MBC1605248.1 sulfatase-like hydrolase/transferase [Listeria rocourtiae]TDR50906.1 phosphoglycerol transferase MdoB-like AlkP superfamily enzyme [Listeria rocourtiae]
MTAPEKKKQLKHPYLVRSLRILGLGLLLSVILHILLDASLSGFNLSATFEMIKTYPIPFLLGILVLMLVYLFLISLVGNVWASSTVFVGTSIIVAFANNQKFVERGEPLYPQEFEMITQWRFMLSMLSTWLVVLLFLGIALIIAIAWTLDRYSRKISAKYYGRDFKYWDRKTLLIRVVGLLFSGVLLFSLTNFQSSDNWLRKAYNIDAQWKDVDPKESYQQYGFVGGLIYSATANIMDKPVNYTESYIKEITQKYSKIADQINETRTNKPMNDVNIVYVMSESFSDPTRLHGVTTSSDPIPETRKIMGQYPSGYSLSQGYGGGTANIEFEALTGLSMYNINPQITSPYQMFMYQKENFPSLVSSLKQNKYETIAIHPFKPSFYRRTDVYNALGFDKFISRNEMTHTETLDDSEYISDASAFQETLDHLKANKTSTFIHLVTMQNHMTYWDKYINTIAVEGVPEKNKQDVETYLQGIKYSDDALKDFVAELDKMKEKTMVVFWGDHLPSVFPEEIVNQNTERTMHETPLFMYANFDLPKKDYGTISPIYFAPKMLELTGSKVSPYYALLTEMSKEVQGLEKNVLINGENQTIIEDQLSPKAREYLEDYKLIEYDLVAGKGYSKSTLFKDE